MSRKLIFTSILILSLTLSVVSLSAVIGHLTLLRIDSEIKLLSGSNESLRSTSMTVPDGTIQQFLFWSENNPDGLELIATYNSMLAWNAENQDDIVAASNYWQMALEYSRQAQHKRPLLASAYLQSAEILWRRGAEYEEIVALLELAQKMSPYDKYVGLFSLELYFAHWSSLENEDRLKAIGYLFNAKDYRIFNWDLERIVSRSPQKNRTCNLLSFNNINLRTCDHR